MTGEEIAVAADRLRAVEGVLDLTIGQVQGKKGRLMQSFRLLVRAGPNQRGHRALLSGDLDDRAPGGGRATGDAAAPARAG